MFIKSLEERIENEERFKDLRMDEANSDNRYKLCRSKLEKLAETECRKVLADKEHADERTAYNKIG